MLSSDLLVAARRLLDAARRAGVYVTVAESCTGGLVAACLTAVAGASEVFGRGFVAYSDRAKVEMLGVSEAVLARHGAVSEEVACAMALGARERAGGGLALAVTGIAGPGGGSVVKPEGLVHIAAVVGGGVVHEELRLGARGRDVVRAIAVERVFLLGLRRLG